MGAFKLPFWVVLLIFQLILDRMCFLELDSKNGLVLKDWWFYTNIGFVILVILNNYSLCNHRLLFGDELSASSMLRYNHCFSIRVPEYK